MGEESRYIKDAKKILENNFLKVKDEMQSLYLTLYVDKVVVLVANKFIQNVLKCRKLPEIAFNVLRIDFTELKEALNKMIQNDTSTVFLIQQLITLIKPKRSTTNLSRKLLIKERI